MYIPSLEPSGRLGLLANLQQALRLVGELVVSQAKKNIVSEGLVDQGVLLNSVTYWLEDDDTVVIGTKIPYGVYLEMGTGLFAKNGNGRTDVPWKYQDEQGEWHSTSGIHPKPWLQPALDSNKKQITQIIGSIK